MNPKDGLHFPPFVAIPPASALDTGALWQRLARRWLLVLLVTMTCFGLSAAVVLNLTPRYYAESVVILDERQARVVSFEQVLSRIPGDSEAVQSEAHILRSRNLLQKTAETLGLVDVPEFNPAIAEPTMLDKVKGWVRNIGPLMGARSSSLPPTEAGINAGVVSTLQSKIWVEPVPKTRAIKIGLLGEDPELTARIVNTHARLYVEAQLEAKMRASRDARVFLADQAAEMREKVRQSEEAVEAYRNRHGLLQGSTDLGGALLTTRQLAEATTQLSEARRLREEADARLEQIRDPQRRGSLPQVVASVTVGRLREQEAVLRQEAMRAGQIYGSQHPQVRQLRFALSDLEAKILSEIDAISESLRNEALVRRNQEQALRERVEELRGDVQRSNSDGVQLAALFRESEAARGLLQTMLNRQQEVRAGEALQQSDSEIISTAATPTDPTYPRTMLFLLASAIASTGLGIASGLVPGRTSRGLRRMADVQPLLEARPLGLVPTMPGGRRSRRLLLEQPESAFGESIRGILTNLVLDGEMPTSVLVASALPGEGKTSVAVALARLATHMGYSTLLVDGDLRRPSLHEVIKAGKSPGLCDYLEGRAELTDILQREASSGLNYVTCGRRTGDPASLLRPSRLAPLLVGWRRSFDIVIFDSSPLVPVSDARLLAHACDQVVFVAQWERTHLDLVQTELTGLRSLGAKIAGVVLTKVDVRKYSRDTFGTSGLLDITYGQRR